MRDLLRSLPLVGGLFALPPAVAVLRLAGAIGTVGLTGRGLTLERTGPLIDRVFALAHVEAVAVVISSPGGSATQSFMIAERIRQLADEKNRRVIAFVEDVAASGGYILALAADEIIAHPASIVGSIGVISGGFGFQEAIARLGIERRVYAQGARKALLDPFRPEDPDEVARLKALQADVYGQFTALVRSRRGAKLKDGGAGLFEGDIWTGHQALELGLVDGLGDIRSTLRVRYGEKVRLYEIAPPRSWLAPFGTEAAAFPDADALIESLERRALWARVGL